MITSAARALARSSAPPMDSRASRPRAGRASWRVRSVLRAPAASFRAACRCALRERGVPSRAREHAPRLQGGPPPPPLPASPRPGRQTSMLHRTCAGPNRPPDLWERSGPRASHDTLRLLAGWLRTRAAGLPHRVPSAPPPCPAAPRPPLRSAAGAGPLRCPTVGRRTLVGSRAAYK